MDLRDLAENELTILKERERLVLLWATPKAKERVRRAENRLAKAKDNLTKAEKELEDAHKMAEKTSDPILRKRLEQTRKRAEIILKKLDREITKSIKKRK